MNNTPLWRSTPRQAPQRLLATHLCAFSVFSTSGAESGERLKRMYHQIDKQNEGCHAIATGLSLSTHSIQHEQHSNICSSPKTTQKDDKYTFIQICKKKNQLCRHHIHIHHISAKHYEVFALLHCSYATIGFQDADEHINPPVSQLKQPIKDTSMRVEADI